MTNDLADNPVRTQAEPARRKDLSARWGWAGIGAIAAVVFVSWLPQFAALGDNHLGRTAGRMALQIHNLQERGVGASHWAADWQPYSNEPYAHHPPLITMLDALFGLFPGFGAFEVVLPQMLLALLALPSAAVLLRALGIRWVPTLLAVAAMAATGYYWVFGIVTFDIGLVMAVCAAMVYLVRTPNPSRLALTLACGAAFLATLGSWEGIVFSATLGLWLFYKRRFDRVTIIVAITMVVALLISLAYMFGVTGWNLMVHQAETRTSTTNASFTVTQFIRRQGKYAWDFLPVWYLLVAPIAIGAALIDKRTRFFAALSTVFAAGWVLVLNNGAYIHQYWAFLVLVPGLVGFGVLLEYVGNLLSRRWATIAASVVALGLAVTFGVMVLGPTADTYVNNPVDAGRLVASHPVPADQTAAWNIHITTARWLAFYWNLDPEEANPAALRAKAHPDNLVLLNLASLPAYLPKSIADRAIARDGTYILVTAADILAVATGS